MPLCLPRCSRCDARLIPDPAGDGLWCQFCGAARDDPEARQLAASAQSAGRDHDYIPPARALDMPPEQHRLLDSAWACIQEGDLVSARFLLHDTLRRFTDEADAWYLLSLTTGDPAEQRLYLERALAAQPYHAYAWRARGVLDGVIPAGDAPDMPDPDGPVEAESVIEACPVCGGALRFDPALDGLACHHCGHRPGDAPGGSGPGPYTRLDHALLRRRFGFTRAWQIGARVLVCQNCAAQITLGAAQLSTVCPFCDSAHILVQDAVGSFDQPDALLPFRLDRAAAARAVHAALDPVRRARVERGDVQGVYLPFWMFEGLASVLLPAALASRTPVRGGVFAVGAMLVSGARSPGQDVLEALLPYDLDALTGYDARYLALWPARLYEDDVVQASLAARAYLKHAARVAALGRSLPPVALARSDHAAYHAPDGPLWEQTRVEIEGLSYRLILLPVWFAALHLSGGGHLPAYVNGQTGQAVIAARVDPGARPRPLSRVIRPLAPLPSRP